MTQTQSKLIGVILFGTLIAVTALTDGTPADIIKISALFGIAYSSAQVIEHADVIQKLPWYVTGLLYPTNSIIAVLFIFNLSQLQPFELAFLIGTTLLLYPLRLFHYWAHDKHDAKPLTNNS
jgi:hypothetical protein